MSAPMTFYIGRDNSVLMRLYQNGLEFDYLTITKVLVKWRTGSINSVDNPSYFTISGGGVRLKFGTLTAITTPQTISALIVVYASGWPNGVVWQERVNIRFLAG